MSAFDDFVTSFFGLYTKPQFRNQDFRAYAAKPAARRSGDEASFVDNALTAPLLALLGFTPGEQIYNQNNRHGRPDFAPTVSEYGVCFVVEDKATGLDLTTDLTDPESHLSQLAGYLRGMGLRSGWLMNGRRLMVWGMENPASPDLALDFDIAAALEEWTNGGAANLSPTTSQALNLLWERYRRETFADLTRLETELALESSAWEAQALPVGANAANQELLVGAVKTLLQDLQADARARLEDYLNSHAEYERRRERVTDENDDRADPLLNQRRETAEAALNTLAPLVGLTPEETQEIRDDLRGLQSTPRAFLNTKALMDKTRETLNAARARTFAGNRRASRALNSYEGELGTLGDALQNFGDAAFAFHQRQGVLRYEARSAIEVHENYALWTSVVQESMLGEMDEAARRDEFALQAAYIVFIRLMLIRVCEDKGILRHRLLSDGGLKRWQEDMDRYFQFANGNPYNTLLNIAFENAQNIYAHFFTGRELFNWYVLDRVRFVRSLAALSRFNFADVDSDLIGTIYNTYVERPEKKKKGQYYTPAAIVNYMLDEAGYVTGPAIIGPNKRLIDPACGSGKFLVEAARRLTAAYKAVGNVPPRQALQSIRDNIYGFDLNPFACYLAEVNLLLQCLDLVKEAIADGKAPRLQRFHIYNVDALSQASGILYYARNNTLMAEEMDVVERIKGRRAEYANGFGWVVANPPYGASLTGSYKIALREWWPAVFYGQPDTYVFFFALALHLLGANGRLAFITPNTYLMGTNTLALRRCLLDAGRVTEIVDLPQGIWKDASVNCALFFLAMDADMQNRRNQQVAIYSMELRDTLDKLTARTWQEILKQPQASWLDNVRNEMNVKWSPLLRQTEEACRVQIDSGKATKIQRLSDLTESSQGIIPFETTAQSRANLFIKPRHDVPSGETDWKPLLDGDGYVGRYEHRFAKDRPYIKYGRQLFRARESKYFDSPKLLFIRLRGRELKRRLVATDDDSRIYNRHNFSNVITKDAEYNLKYILAVFNSSLLNY